MTFNFLLASRGTPGNLSPLLTAGRRLQRAGHNIRIITDPAVRDEVEAHGFDFVSWTRAPVGADADAGAIKDLRAAFHKVTFVPILDYAADVVDECRRIATDAVLSIDVLFGAALGAEHAGVGLALLSPHISVKPIPGVPSAGSGLKAPTTLRERSEVDAAGKQFIDMMDLFLPAMNEARATLKLTPLKHVLDIFDKADRVLLAISRAFDFPADSLPDNVYYVGPLLDEPGWSEPWRECWPHGPELPRALVSFSTGEQGQTTVLQRIVNAIGTITMDAIVTTGPALDVNRITAPENVRVLRSAPHDAVMQQASLVVTHGGHGTVSRALIRGLPLLVIPNGRDQQDNALRVEARGAGLVLPVTASQTEIAGALRRLISEPQFRIAAGRLGEAIASECDSSTLVEELEAVVALRRNGAASKGLPLCQ